MPRHDSATTAESTQSTAELLTDWRTLLGRPWANVGILFLLFIALNVTFALLTPAFLGVNNLLNIGTNMAYIGIMAGAQTLLIIAGGLDLSVAAVAGLSGVIVSMLYAGGTNVWLAALIALLIGAGIGAVNGFFVTRVGINALIATLGMLSIAEGIALVLTGGLTEPFNVPGFSILGQGRIFEVPIPLILMLVMYLVLYWVLSQTRFGRFVYATGGNPEASRLAGVPVKRILMILFVLSALSGVISGFVLATTLGAAAPTVASESILTVIAAVILGGTSLFGGRGSIWGTLLAVMILGTLNNGLVLLNVSSFWQSVTQGVVLLLAVGLDQLRSRALGE